MGGPNLEVFKFAMYIFFPIGTMYYFGTNLDNRFSVPGFWPSESQRGRIPTEPEEIEAELAKIRKQNERYRETRLREQQQQQQQQSQLVQDMKDRLLASGTVRGQASPAAEEQRQE